MAIPNSTRTPANFKDLTDQRFGRLVVLYRVPSPKKWQVIWWCQCDCGNQVPVVRNNLRKEHPHTISCGCWDSQVTTERNTTHGLSHLPEYTVWINIRNRCLNPVCEGFENYGGAGITISNVWRDSFETFYRDIGPRPTPKHQVDRYPNNNGNYEPGNVRWATPKENCRNKKTNHLITFQGQTKTAVEWSENLGIDYYNIMNRFRRKWTIERTFTEPIRVVKSRKAIKKSSHVQQ